MHSKKVLITGIDSFTGPYIGKELELNGYDVYGTSLKKTNNKNIFKVDIIEYDELFNVINILKPDFVIHLAAITHIQHQNIQEIYQTNIIGTYNLLKSIFKIDFNVQSILLISSANIYGNSYKGKITENFNPKPVNDYAVSKLAMEKMAELWFDKLPINIVRPFNYTGVGQSIDFIFPKILHHFKNRVNEIELGNLNVFRDFSDVRFVAKAYQAILFSSEYSKIYNVSSGMAVSLRDIIKKSENIAGYKIKIKVNPKFIRKNEVKILFGSNEKLLMLSPRLEMISLDDTIQWFFNS